MSNISVSMPFKYTDYQKMKSQFESIKKWLGIGVEISNEADFNTAKETMVAELKDILGLTELFKEDIDYELCLDNDGYIWLHDGDGDEAELHFVQDESSELMIMKPLPPYSISSEKNRGIYRFKYKVGSTKLSMISTEIKNGDTSQITARNSLAVIYDDSDYRGARDRKKNTLSVTTNNRRLPELGREQWEVFERMARDIPPFLAYWHDCLIKDHWLRRFSELKNAINAAEIPEVVIVEDWKGYNRFNGSSDTCERRIGILDGQTLRTIYATYDVIDPTNPALNTDFCKRKIVYRENKIDGESSKSYTLIINRDLPCNEAVILPEELEERIFAYLQQQTAYELPLSILYGVQKILNESGFVYDRLVLETKLSSGETAKIVLSAEEITYFEQNVRSGGVIVDTATGQVTWRCTVPFGNNGYTVPDVIQALYPGAIMPSEIPEQSVMEGLPEGFPELPEKGPDCKKLMRLFAEEIGE